MKELHIYNVPDRKVHDLWVKSYIDIIDGQKYRCTTRSGKLWAGIQTRLTDKFKTENPTYAEKYNLFEDYQQFAGWCQGQYGYLNKTDNGRFWHLDKDLLKEGGSYGPDYCMFVPEYVNTLLVRPSTQQNCLLGVTRRKSGVRMVNEYTKPFVVRGFCKEKQQDATFYFSDEMDAHKKWQECKVDKIDFLLTNRTEILEHKQLLLALKTIKENIQRDLFKGCTTQR